VCVVRGMFFFIEEFLEELPSTRYGKKNILTLMVSNNDEKRVKAILVYSINNYGELLSWDSKRLNKKMLKECLQLENERGYLKVGKGNIFGLNIKKGFLKTKETSSSQELISEVLTCLEKNSNENLRKELLKECLQAGNNFEDNSCSKCFCM